MERSRKKKNNFKSHDPIKNEHNITCFFMYYELILILYKLNGKLSYLTHFAYFVFLRRFFCNSKLFFMDCIFDKVDTRKREGTRNRGHNQFVRDKKTV